MDYRWLYALVAQTLIVMTIAICAASVLVAVVRHVFRYMEHREEYKDRR